MAPYLLVLEDVGLKPLNTGDTCGGKQWWVMPILLLYLYT